MSDQKTPHQKIQALGADLSNTVNEVLAETKPVLNRMANRIHESVQDLSNQGQDAALEVEHQLKNGTRHVRITAEHYIQHSPLKSVLVAAGTGAAVALVLSWFIQSRKN